MVFVRFQDFKVSIQFDYCRLVQYSNSFVSVRSVNEVDVKIDRLAFDTFD